MKKLLLISLLFSFTITFSRDKGCHKSGGKCTGSKYCTACKNCKYCNYCNSGGICGVCSPESFEEKKKPIEKATKKKQSKKSFTKTQTTR